MYNSKDLYPTRTGRHIDMFPRLDPVVHTAEGQRWEGPLSRAELDSFERNGFLSFDALFSDEEVAALREALEHLNRDPSIKDWEGCITEPGGDDVRSVFRIHDPAISRQFARVAADPRILRRVRQILASDVYIHQSRINYKPGFRGKGFQWHSDFETWHAEDGMPRMRAVSCSILLTDNTEYNAPLMLVPGSHRYHVPCTARTPDNNYRTSLKNQEAGVPDTDSLSALIHQNGLQSFTGPAGSVLLFECNTLHASNANLSPFPRSNAFFVYNSVRNTPVAPFAASKPRPAFLGERENFEAIGD
jgi:ectoine hydroxylase